MLILILPTENNSIRPLVVVESSRHFPTSGIRSQCRGHKPKGLLESQSGMQLPGTEGRDPHLLNDPRIDPFTSSSLVVMTLLSRLVAILA